MKVLVNGIFLRSKICRGIMIPEYSRYQSMADAAVADFDFFWSSGESLVVCWVGTGMGVELVIWSGVILP